MSSKEVRKEVYVSCRSIFVGQNAQLRRPKKVKEVLQQQELKIMPLLNKYGLDEVAVYARNLLDSRVFESQLRAKIEFPDLFEISPLRDVQRTESEHEAVRSEAEALAEVEPEAVDDSKLEELSEVVGM